MNATLAFLEKILPPEGDHWYVTAIDKKNRMEHRWHRTLLSLASCLVEEDGKGATVYFACGIYRERSAGRKGSNSAGAASLWSDIDAGDGKQFQTAAGALNAVVAFCAATGLPKPLVVGSGFGLHCYWPLGTSVDPETWKRYANGLAQLLRQHGIKHERTTDLASLLRPVGTTNRKHGLISVKIIADADDFEISDLGCLLDVAPKQKVSAPTIINGHTLAGKLGNITSRSRYSGGLSGCGQFRYRDSRGYVPEPLWHLALGVFGFIEGDGDDAAHEWSAEDDRYNRQQVQERLDRIRASVGGATTCERFHQENPETCEACPHWQKINSPIALCTARDRPSDQIETSGILNLPPLPEGYAWNDSNNLCEVRENNNGKQVESIISEHPLYFDSSRRRESRDGRSLYYRQYTRSDGWHDIIVSAGALRASSGSAEFSDKGANISDWPAFVRYSVAAINMQYGSDVKQEMLYEQFGWKDNDTSFLYGLDLYTPAGIRKVVGDKNVTSRTGTERDVWVGPSKNSSLSEWSNAANKLFATGAEAQSVSICASFGAVFQRFLSRDEGGSVLSLVTHRGGRGKTTALAGALSVWGRKSGFGLENIDSSISKGATLASIGNLPLFYDQFDTTDAVAVRNFIDLFTNGRDKRRIGRDGQVATPGMQWQTTMFTASNASLVDSIESQGNAALATRILEMSVDVPEHLKQEYQADQLKDRLRDNSGHAGAWFLSKLMAADNVVRAKHRLEYWQPIIRQQGHLGTEHRFWERLVTTVAVAAEIVGYQILILDAQRIVEWLINEIKSRFTGNDDWQVEELARFMADHNQNQLVVSGPFVPGRSDAIVLVKPMRELFIRKEKSNGRIYISKDELRRWCVKRGVNTRELTEYLCKESICLNRSKNITLGAGTDIASARLQCIEINGNHSKIGEAMGDQRDNVLPFARPEPDQDNSLGSADEDLPY